ncbi:hypothetical protein F5Y10DRAFT_286658 [Nemania abortiva]|nr:hypothetical protein F5Y10DRAFT_286658 [Nemania abortiva]
MLNFANTTIQFSSQWKNPSDITTLLMIISGDVVQKALAQTTGCLYTPVCFSFGWVTYSFMALIGMMGDGRLLPPPDYPVKVFNLDSGYSRDNKNWVIGRIVRDMEAFLSRDKPMLGRAIRISVWKAKENPNRYTKHSYSKIHILGLATTTIQLAIASIPLILYGDWSILFLTAAGTLLAIVTGSLPQWRAEKLPNRQHSKAKFALTSGNGSRDIMVVIGDGQCLDLEELCLEETPRNERPWEKFSREQTGLPTEPKMVPGGLLHFYRTMTCIMNTMTIGGLPSGFWITLCVCVVQSLAWLVLLITTAAIAEHTWFLILVGLIGMFQNAYLAAVERSPRNRNLPLEHVETILMKKVMDGLMDLEVAHGCGRALVSEFFPGPLREEEDAWWKGDTKAYDDIRFQARNTRGRTDKSRHNR